MDKQLALINKACGIAELAGTNVELTPEQVRYMLKKIADLQAAIRAAKGGSDD